MEEEKLQKELKRRDTILNGNVIKTVLIICLPLLFYNLCNYFYGIYDMVIVEAANLGEAADVVVLDQIKNMISTISTAIATGGAILVSRLYGEGRMDRCKRCANAFFAIGFIIAILTLLFIPIGKPFLRLLRTDESTIANAFNYYVVQMITLAIITINSVLIAIEKSKGNTFKIFIFNIGVIVIKITLSTIFAYGNIKGVNVTWLACATLIAQMFLFISLIICAVIKNNILRIEIKSLNLNKHDCINIIKLALPVFLGSFLFHFGKVYINSEATVNYSKQVVGALGISNVMAGLLSTTSNSFEDGTAAIISQNNGAKNGERIKKIFFANAIIITIICLIGTISLFLLKQNIASFFAKDNLEYKNQIVNIFKWECLDIVFMGFISIGYTAFYGFGKTKITMILSTMTLFAYRIPILMILMHVVKYNYESCGIAMFGSNMISGTITLILSFIFINKLDKSRPDLFTN